MRILLLSDAYPPEIRSGSHLVFELACGLQKAGHEVTVATTQPQYSLTMKDVKKKYSEDTVENGIRVLRIKTLPIHNVSFLIRGINQISLLFFFAGKVKKYLMNPIDVIFVYCPPLPLAIIGYKLKKKYNSILVLNIQDIFPQNAVDLGIIQNPLIINFFEWMEKKAYEKSDLITVHSEGNRDFLVKEKGLNPKKIEVIYNWIDIEYFEKAGNKSKFRAEYKLDSKFVVLFGGALGPSQGLEQVIDAAAELQNHTKDIVFVFAGDGSEKRRLKALAREKQVSNVEFIPFVSRDEYPLLLKSVNVGLVSLSNRNKTPAVPGKILGYMAVGLPVLAYLQKESDGHKFIKKTGCGISVISGDKEGFISAILKIRNNSFLRKKMGENGREYVKRNLNKEIAIKRYERIFCSLTN